jgi:hypothetical protein
MISKGEKLILSTKEETQKICKQFNLILSGIAILLFIIAAFFHRMIGLELLQVFQTIYYTHFITTDYTQVYGLLKFLSFSSWNFQEFNGNVNVNSRFEHGKFS